MTVGGPSSMSRMTALGEADERAAVASQQEAVNVSTLDAFIAESGIGRVGYLKVDTEGAEISVLKGATDLLRWAEIDVIQVEVGMGVNNKWHVPLGDIITHLAHFDYRLFLITEQHPSFTPRVPYLDRADALFLSPRMVSRFSEMTTN